MSKTYHIKPSADYRKTKSDWLSTVVGFMALVPIPYFNANIAVLARKLDEWATIPDDVLDQQKTRALELARQFDPEVLRPQYEAVLAV